LVKQDFIFLDQHSDLLSLQNSNFGEMASFIEKRGMWSIRARVRKGSGFVYERSYSLWETKEEAENDLDLFIWYKSSRDFDDPLVPSPRGEWFKTILPNSDWDEIREYLTNRAPVERKQKRRRVELISTTVNQRNVKRKLAKPKASLAVDESEQVHDDSVREVIIRKQYSDLSRRRQVVVNKTVEQSLRACWSRIAPNQNDLQLKECVANFLGVHKRKKDSIVGAIQDAYKLADEKKNENQKTQILSMFALNRDTSRSKLESIIGLPLSTRKYTHARNHAAMHGPGQPIIKVIHSRGVERKKQVIERFVEYCMANGIITANGRSVTIDKQGAVSVPNVKRVEGKQPLIKNFEEQERINMAARIHEEGSTKEFISLRRKSMEDIISVVCPDKHCSLAALDVVGQLHGTLNFKVLRKKLEQLKTTFPHMQPIVDELLHQSSGVEEILSNKNKFRSKDHFCSHRRNEGPLSHCHYYAFGKVDPAAVPSEGMRSPCGHCHIGVCDLCDSIELFGARLDKLGVEDTEEVKRKIQELNISYHSKRYRHYAGHQARLAHEAEVAEHVKEQLKLDPGLIALTADYAMKFLPLKDSEAQNEFFGKSGINWHGIQFLWYCRENSCFRQYFVNQCVEDSTEDGISVVALLYQVR
jgi:hypothetical protein